MVNGKRLALHLVLLLGLAPKALADVDVEGFVLYQDKAFTYGGWTGADPSLPIPRANVEILNSLGFVIASGSSALDGSFSIATPASAAAMDIRVRVLANTSNAAGFQPLRVTNSAGSIYASTGPLSYSIDDSMSSFDVGTITVAKTLLAGGEEGSPFNMLDMGVRAWEYIMGPCGRAAVGLVTVRWPISGSFASGSTASMDFDDGYDDSVILHELGHVMHNLYSDSDSPGGSHSFGDSDQDPRLSLGEGFATFFGGAVKDYQGQEALYMDLNASSQSAGIQLRLRLESTDPYASGAFGSADEVAVACTLYDIIDTEFSIDSAATSDDDFLRSASLVGTRTPHEAWFDMFEGPAKAASNVMLSDFWDGWFSVHGSEGKYVAMEHLFGLHQVRFVNDQDEPNGSSLLATPIFGFGSYSSWRTLYASSATPPTPGGADQDWYSMDLVAGSRVEISTRYPDAASDANTIADTQLSMFDMNLVQLAADEDGGTGRNALIASVQAAETGRHYFRVRSTDSLRDLGIYDYQVRYLFQNFPPSVGIAPAAIPNSVNRFRRETTLEVTVSDQQPLSFSWTPQNGGTILGSGRQVTFRAPAGDHRGTVFSIELVIEDSLGAATQPLTVEVPFYSKAARRGF